MKRNKTHYEFEGVNEFERVDDYILFLEHALREGYRLSIIIDEYLLKFVPEGFDRIRFANDYFSAHKHALTVEDDFGKKIAECDSLSEFKVLDIGGKLEKLIESYISKK